MGWIKVEDSLPGVGCTVLDRKGIKAGGVLAVRKGGEIIVANTEYLRNNTDEYTYWSYLPRMPDAEEPLLTQEELRGLRALLRRLSDVNVLTWKEFWNKYDITGTEDFMEAIRREGHGGTSKKKETVSQEG